MTGDILEHLAQLGITVTARDGKLCADGPDEAFTPAVDALIRNNRVRLLNKIITPLIPILNKVSSYCNNSPDIGLNFPPPFEQLDQLGINEAQEAISCAGIVRDFPRKTPLDPHVIPWIDKANQCQKIEALESCLAEFSGSPWSIVQKSQMISGYVDRAKDLITSSGIDKHGTLENLAAICWSTTAGCSK